MIGDYWKQIELVLRTADLIAADRRGTRRDDGFHRNMRSTFESAMRDLAADLRRICQII